MFVRQERELTDVTRTITAHGDSTNFLVNTNSMTNYAHIQALSRSHSQLPALFFSLDDQVHIRSAAVASLNKTAAQRAKKRKHNRGMFSTLGFKLASDYCTFSSQSCTHARRKRREWRRE